MERLAERSQITRLIVGITVIVAGIIFTLDNFGIIHGFSILRFWPVALIAVGVAKARQNRGFWGGFWGSFLALVGVALLLENLHLVRIPIGKLWPLILVAVGIRVLQRAGSRREEGQEPETRTAVRLDETAVFGGFDRSIVTSDFQGGALNAVFGGFELDLSRCAMQADETHVDVLVAFGGGDLRVPEGWDVQVKVFALFGGTDDSTVHPPIVAGERPKKLVVDGFVVFGGLDIKN